VSLYNKIAGQKVERIEALSDGVFAIAMTIMVFDLKDPASAIINSEERLLTHLMKILPQMLTYFLSFMTLGIFWTGQSTQFSYIKRYNRQLSWISLFFLLFVTLIPFTTSVLSHHINNTLSVLLYWFNILMLGLLLLLHWRLARHHKFTEFEDDVEEKLVRKAITVRILVGQLLYLIGAGMSFFDTYASILFIILVQLNYALGLFTFVQKKWIRKIHREEIAKPGNEDIKDRDEDVVDG
jgi:uncharacterized membrane protein